MPVTDILAELRWRGLIHQTTDEAQLHAWLQSSRTLYAGFDPSANSLHVGSMLPLLMLRRFQRAGHRPIALVGGATGMIGDPTGKSQERKLLDRDALQANVEGIRAQMEQFLDFSGSNAAVLVNNYDWMSRFTFLDFLRDVGKNFPVNVMLAKDSIKSRLEQSDAGLSYTEFSYLLLQAYDFVYLSQHHDCNLQIGGSDQWGNITAGIDLARRSGGPQLHALTCPLLTKSDGTKMGKTESGAVWLSSKRTSPYALYQYLFNVEDADVDKLLKFLTDLTGDEVEGLANARAADPGKREGQRRLAEEMTRMVHGEAGLASARRATEIFFGAEVANLSDRELGEIFADVPSSELPRSRLAGEGLNIVDALVEAGLFKSKSDARRTVDQGGAYVNNRAIKDVKTQLTVADLASESVMVLRSGKKKYALLRFRD